MVGRLLERFFLGIDSGDRVANLCEDFPDLVSCGVIRVHEKDRACSQAGNSETVCEVQRPGR